MHVLHSFSARKSVEQNECWTSNHRAQHEARGEHLNLNGKVSPHFFSTESWKASLEDMATWPRQHITCDFFSKNTPFLERIYLPCQRGYTYFAREVYPLWKVSTTSVEWHVMLGIPFLIIFSHTGHTLKKHLKILGCLCLDTLPFIFRYFAIYLNILF